MSERSGGGRSSAHALPEANGMSGSEVRLHTMYMADPLEASVAKHACNLALSSTSILVSQFCHLMCSLY